VPSVDPGDYTLDGTSYTIFTGASIDAGNPKLVHLTGAIPAMAGDITVDELFDDGYGSSFSLYAGILPVPFTNTTNPGGTMADDIIATFQGIVSGNDSINNVWVSDAAGPYHGILVYDLNFDTAAAVGDEIIFAAERSPYNNLSELVNPVLISVVSNGLTPYGPSVIPASDISSSIPADTDPAESWEGQLVKITGFTVDSLSVVSPNYACTWSDSKASYIFYIGNTAGNFNLLVGATYTSVTGLIDWYWDGPYYRINPRSQKDIEGGIVPPPPQIIITEVMQNPDSVADASGEWFEVYNNSDNPIDMNGWVMKDLGSNSHTIVGSLIVAAHDFAVLGNNANPFTNGGYTCDYVFPSTFSLGNSDDELILYLPGGLTKVDHIEWDGGHVWPDPTGASMVYTGVTSENNNDGTLWATAYTSESSYPDPACDLGSPGTNGEFQVLTEGFSLSLNVLLESYYNPASDSMTNYYRANLILPYSQPYNPALPYYGNASPAWLYSGSETAIYLPYYSIDWVLIELRDGLYGKAGTGIQVAALLEADGQVCSYNGSARLSVKDQFASGLFIAVYHLNHIGIISDEGLYPNDGDVVYYDFSSDQLQVLFGSASYKELEPGVWGMVAGDINGDGSIDILDKDDGWNPYAGLPALYQGNNILPDDQVNNQDKNQMWAPNQGYSSVIP
jgi:hypothetical protein